MYPFHSITKRTSPGSAVWLDNRPENQIHYSQKVPGLYNGILRKWWRNWRRSHPVPATLEWIRHRSAIAGCVSIIPRGAEDRFAIRDPNPNIPVEHVKAKDINALDPLWFEPTRIGSWERNTTVLIKTRLTWRRMSTSWSISGGMMTFRRILLSRSSLNSINSWVQYFILFEWSTLLSFHK